MRLVVVGCCGSIALALAGCASAPAVELPVNVGNGLGSQYGNYGAQADGEAVGPAGERCIVFDWDRPISRDRAIRTKSESCESQERPGVMVAREISRTVIPMSQSNLTDAHADAGK
jgi:hypothetical protein